MPKISKYKNPEDRKLAHNVHMLRKQQDCRLSLLKLLGGKCSLCPETRTDVLEVTTDKDLQNQSWLAKFKIATASPALFHCYCANCNALRKAEEARARIEEFDLQLLRALGWDKIDGKLVPPVNKAEEEEQEEEVEEKPDEEYQQMVKEALERANQKEKERLEAQQKAHAEADKKYTPPPPNLAQHRANAANPMDMYAATIPIPARKK